MSLHPARGKAPRPEGRRPDHILSRWLKWLLLVPFVIFLLAQAWFLGWVVYWKHADPETTRFMSIRLDALRRIQPDASLRRQRLPYARISPHLKRALIAAEDGKFVHHEGFDWDGIQRALERNEQRGKVVAGGSTISQQLAKNLFLTPEKSLWRKGQEAIITLMIEAVWDKRRILEVYLNVIEWGNGVFGAEAAARHYYGVSAAALSAEQAARLAGMVPSPRYYDRSRNAPGLARKTEIILARMPAARIP